MEASKNPGLGSSLENFLQVNGYIKIPLQKYMTGHFVLPVLVNGVRGHFLLDPGASHSVVDDLQKEKFLLKTEPSKDQGTGLGGQAETSISFGNELLLGDQFHVDSQTIYVMSLGHVNVALQHYGVAKIEGVIGADILNMYAAVLEYVDNCLFLRKEVGTFTSSDHALDYND